MAAMISADINKAARIFARNVYFADVANCSHDNLVAAVTALDNAFEGTPPSLPNQALSIAQNMNLMLPDPFKSNATVVEKSSLLAVWAAVKYGLAFDISGGT